MFGRSFYKMVLAVCLGLTCILVSGRFGWSSEVSGTYIWMDPQGPVKLMVFGSDGGGFSREGEAMARFDWEFKNGEVWLGMLDGRSNPLRIFKVDKNRLISADGAGEIYRRD